MAKKNIGVRIDESDFKQLQQIAKQQKCTVTEVARAAIEQLVSSGDEDDTSAKIERIETALDRFESRNAQRIESLKGTIAQIDTSAAEQALVKAVRQATRGIKFEVPEMPKLDTKKIDATMRKLEEKAEQMQKASFMRMLKIGAAVALGYGMIFVVGWGAVEWKLSQFKELSADVNTLENTRAALEKETYGVRITANDKGVFVAMPPVEDGAWNVTGDSRSYYKLK